MIIISHVLFPDFLVSALLAARILKYNETQPDDGRTVAEAETEQRVADHRVEETAKWCQQLKEGEGEGTDDGMKSEEREELASLFQNLDLDPSSHVTDACHQVSRIRIVLWKRSKCYSTVKKNKKNIDHTILKRNLSLNVLLLVLKKGKVNHV